MDKLLA